MTEAFRTVMSHIEESIVNQSGRLIGWFVERRGNTGVRIMLAGFALGFLCWLPLLLYIAFGPRDGNPIGLGLLAVLGMPVMAMGVCVGLVVIALQSRAGRAR